jgi:hypothetical protein
LLFQTFHEGDEIRIECFNLNPPVSLSFGITKLESSVLSATTVNLFWFFVYAVVVFRLARIGRNEHLSCFGSWWKVFLGSLQARTSETPTCSCLQAYG